jgi:enoyl-CoA hydratase/carnithine racemase
MLSLSLRSLSRKTASLLQSHAPVARLVQVAHSSTLKESYENVLVERDVKESSGVGLVTLNRPKALNALSDGLFQDLIHATRALDADDEIGCLVVTGSAKAFAAGADISEMQTKTFDEAYKKVGITHTTM